MVHVSARPAGRITHFLLEINTAGDNQSHEEESAHGVVIRLVYER